VLKNDLKTFPFTSKHFVKFKRELQQAKNFEELMLKKQALKQENGMTYINTYSDAEEYKRKFLTGAYATLRPMYDTEMPYIFWSDLYRLFVKSFENRT
jgi:hypothetical protein